MKPVLPTLEEGFRWKIEPLYEDEWEAVRVRLQKKTWLGWLTLRSEVASTFIIGTTLESEVERTSANLWNRQFGDNPVNDISGTYYGDNERRDD